MVYKKEICKGDGFDAGSTRVGFCHLLACTPWISPQGGNMDAAAPPV